MLVILIVSLSFSGMISLTAYLQSSSRWWNGPLATVLVFGLGVVAATPSEIGGYMNYVQPLKSFSSMTVICSVLIGLGSILALLFRRIMKPTKIATRVFWGSWATSFGGMMLIALT